MNDALVNCMNHVQTLTGLRCNRCDKPVCAKCVVLTPVGYRCKACVRREQNAFETLRLQDYLLVPMVVMALAVVGSALSVISPFLTVLVTPVAAGIIANTVHRVIGRRWSRRLDRLVVAAFFLGCLPMACSLLVFLPDIWSIAGLMLFLGIGIHTLLMRLRGIVL